MRTWWIVGRGWELALGVLLAGLLGALLSALTKVPGIAVVLPLALSLCAWPGRLQIGSDGVAVSRFGRRRYVSFADVRMIWDERRISYVALTKGSVPLGAYSDVAAEEISGALRSGLEAWRTRAAPTRLLVEDGGDPFRGADAADAREVLENPRYPARVRVTAARIVARDPDGAASLHVALEETADPEVQAELSALLRPRG